MTRIESGVSLYDYTKMIILGKLMEDRKRNSKAQRNRKGG